ncbi:MAG: CoA transferase, partial [Actinobacteria bacterium]|nr:CoA transferase [Actinomycetota bacterium]
MSGGADGVPAAPFAGLRVVQGRCGIEVAYCTKLLVDAGADVVVVEPEGGHPLRHRRPAGSPSDAPTPLFDYLHAGKLSVGDGPAADD